MHWRWRDIYEKSSPYVQCIQNQKKGEEQRASRCLRRRALQDSPTLRENLNSDGMPSNEKNNVNILA